MSIIQQPSLQMKRVSHGNFLMKNVLKHNVVFNEGTKGDAAYILTDGRIEISGIVDGNKKVFAILSPISLFGEMALFLEDQTRTATAIALEDSKVIVVTKDDLDESMREMPQVISSILTVLVSRLKTTTKKAMRVPSIPMGMVRILQLFAVNDTTEVRYDTAVRLIAEAFVTNPETIERYLHGLAQQNFIAIGRDEHDTRIIRILERDLLNAVLKQKK
ncbi:Crp/Fnr family transcriptional regulator [Pseudodesulfovibrio tunisiensis]|uniref:Crp/Fnr family transcriptional regulator n=1 Tax=Pseudodesulfovibrio tunisiensis TaxID=463192 RepID=UPI001FB345EC|nr:cyclic nucleotide-binding domain-containing protein [Pseudodesulfovibrio tunisiensis]